MAKIEVVHPIAVIVNALFAICSYPSNQSYLLCHMNTGWDKKKPEPFVWFVYAWDIPTQLCLLNRWESPMPYEVISLACFMKKKTCTFRILGLF